MKQAMRGKILDSFLTFLLAITLLTIAPGADTVLVIRNSLRAGTKDGLVTTVAICSGLFVHATVSAVGISIVLLQSAWMFTALKYLGALYLFWLGFSTIRNTNSRQVGVKNVEREKFVLLRSVREGLLSNVLNPKPIVFYMAFLPQFIDPVRSALVQSLELAGVHFIVSVLWLGIVTLLAMQMKQWLHNPLARRRVDQGLGVGLCGFGLALAADTYQS